MEILIPFAAHASQEQHPDSFSIRTDRAAMFPLLSSIRRRWHEPSGYREVLNLAFPLILSTASISILHFFDRMILFYWNPEAMGAALNGGISNFMIVGFFLGLVTYANTFVAQYMGAGRPERVGPSVWQALYCAMASFWVLILLMPIAPWIFKSLGNWLHHDIEQTRMQTEYFRILCLAGGLMLFGGAISTFYSGRGKPWTIVWVNFSMVSLNIFLDYLWVFGKWGFPEMGIAGAGWATAVAALYRAALFLFLFTMPRHRKEFNTWSGRGLDRDLMGRLLRYGLPNGLQLFADIFAVWFFVQFVGGISSIALSATTMAFNINSLAFLPMIGLGIAVSVMVGQNLGKNNPAMAAKAVWTATHIGLAYTSIYFTLFLLAPDLLLTPYTSASDPAQAAAVKEIAEKLMTFLAIFVLFDTLALLFSGALRGAGDTRFIMNTFIVLGSFSLVLPTWYFVEVREFGIHAAWTFLTLYAVLLSIVFFFRFRQGKWKSMRVIEHAPPSVEMIDAPDGAILETKP